MRLVAASDHSNIVHASAVAVAGQVVLITGAAGSGKSSLALTLMAYGAQLVADDRVILTVRSGQVLAQAPEAIHGQIEARGIGILGAEALGQGPVALVVDMDARETDRLPPKRQSNLLGISLPLLHNTGNAAFAPAILQYLRGSDVTDQIRSGGQ